MNRSKPSRIAHQSRVTCWCAALTRSRLGHAVKQLTTEVSTYVLGPIGIAASYHTSLPNRLAVSRRPADALAVNLRTPGAAGPIALFGGAPCAPRTNRAILARMSLIEAEFENGMLRPSSPLRLRPGERVGIVVVRRPDRSRWDLERLSRAPSSDESRLTEQGLGEWVTALDREDKG